MSASQHSDPTVAYYDTHAKEYAADTFGVDMRPLYQPFLTLVPRGGHILDAGCGPGRDSTAFQDLGYRVTAFDASTALARMAATALGQPVRISRFQDLALDEMFDGIWASASLLHVPSTEMDDVFDRLTRALRPNGVWFLSFKLGEGEEEREGRRFTYHTESSLRALLATQRALEVVKVWSTLDQRPGREKEEWVNALVRKDRTKTEHS